MTLQSGCYFTEPTQSPHISPPTFYKGFLFTHSHIDIHTSGWLPSCEALLGSLGTIQGSVEVSLSKETYTWKSDTKRLQQMGEELVRNNHNNNTDGQTPGPLTSPPRLTLTQIKETETCRRKMGGRSNKEVKRQEVESNWGEGCGRTKDPRGEK